MGILLSFFAFIGCVSFIASIFEYCTLLNEKIERRRFMEKMVMETPQSKQPTFTQYVNAPKKTRKNEFVFEDCSDLDSTDCSNIKNIKRCLSFDNLEEYGESKAIYEDGEHIKNYH